MITLTIIFLILYFLGGALEHYLQSYAYERLRRGQPPRLSKSIFWPIYIWGDLTR
jgi:hypothetical protein